MAEADKAPFIHLSIDQEVFIDSVRDGDNVEDATVATEVTSFDRVGDAFVLEGAVVFAGYLTRDGQNDVDEATRLDTLAIGFDDGQYAQHVHHRMPFVLRVPVKAQQRGIVNVASRIASWRLEVIGAGWMRVLADLNIVGLNGKQGYHFQCGAQEDGNLFFQKPFAQAPAEDDTQVWTDEPENRQTDDQGSDTQGTDVHEDAANAAEDTEPTKVLEPMFRGESEPSEEDTVVDDFLDTPFDPQSTGALGQPEEELPSVAPVEESAKPDASLWTRGAVGDSSGPIDDYAEPQVEESNVHPKNAELQAQVEAVSEARGGVEPAAQESKEAFSTRQLLSLDKAIDGVAPSPEEPSFTRSSEPAEEDLRAPTEPAVEEGVTEPRVSAEEATDAPTGDIAGTSAQFEFEHQVSTTDFDAEAQIANSEEESFVASRSFHEDGFTATAGFVPTIRVGTQMSVSDAYPEEGGELARGEAQAIAEGEAVPPGIVDRNLWRFVDFNAPERFYTLRYAIVMEEESLELVAERLGCSKSDLMRVNRLTSENVFPGQPLRVPATAVVAAR